MKLEYFYNSSSGITPYITLGDRELTYEFLEKHMVHNLIAIRSDASLRLAGECLILGSPTRFILIEPDEEVSMDLQGFTLLAYDPLQYVPYVLDGHTISLNKRMWIPE